MYAGYCLHKTRLKIFAAIEFYILKYIYCRQNLWYFVVERRTQNPTP